LPNTRRVWVDFFQVLVEDEAGRSFSELIDEAMRREGAERTVTLRGSLYRLQSAQTLNNGIRICNLARAQMQRAWYLQDANGEREEPRIRDTQGYGDDTWFLFEPSTNCVVLQRNWFNGCRPEAFETYFMTLLDVRRLELLPILTPDAMAKLERMREVRRFELTVANPRDLDALYNAGKSGRYAAEVLREHGATRVELVSSLGIGRRYKDKGMNLQSVLSEVRALASQGRDNGIIRLKIGGYLDDEERTQDIDLLVDRVQYYGNVEVVNRMLSPQGCQRLLIEAYNAYRGVIAQALGA